MDLTGIPGRITDVERVQRLHEIDKLNQEGLSDSKIADKLGLSINVIKRSQKYLENLKIADLTPEVLAEKRTELYLELSEAAAEAKSQYEMYKYPRRCAYCEGTGKITDGDSEEICEDCEGQGGIHRPIDANRFLETWSAILEKKARLYGLDKVKTDNIIQFNQFNQTEYVSDMKLTGETRELTNKLSDMIKESHEERVRNR